MKRFLLAIMMVAVCICSGAQAQSDSQDGIVDINSVTCDYSLIDGKNQASGVLSMELMNVGQAKTRKVTLFVHRGYDDWQDFDPDFPGPPGFGPAWMIIAQNTYTYRFGPDNEAPDSNLWEWANAVIPMFPRERGDAFTGKIEIRDYDENQNLVAFGTEEFPIRFRDE